MSLLLILSLVQSWQIGPRMPTPGYGFACGVVGNRVFAIGGLQAGGNPSPPRRAVEAYDIAQDSWIAGFAPMPVPRWYAGCAVLEGKLYVIGGTDGRIETRRVDRFDPATNHWDTVAPLPWPRQALGACEYQGRVYAIGGYINHGMGSYARTVACFVPDSSLGRWHIVDSLNTPRASLGAAVAGDRIYVVGGRYFNPTRSTEYYVPNRWQIDPRALLEPRSGLAAVGYLDHVCAIGGMGRRGALSSAEVLNTVSGQWVEVEPMNSPRAFLGAAIVGTDIIALGGLDDQQRIVGTVEAHALFMPGIEEEPSVRPRTQLWSATVFRGRVRINPGSNRQVGIYDQAGKLMLSRIGPVDIELTQGLYFTRMQTDQQTWTTSKIVVVR